MHFARHCLLFLLATPAFALNVIIDPGHGGVDNGTTRKEYREKDTSLDVALRLAARLRKNKQFHVTLTRSDDRQLSLQSRAQIADRAGGDVFISIHVNSSPDRRAKGAEFYFQNELAADDQAMFLAHQENVAPETAETETVNPLLKDTSPAVRSILEDLLSADRIQASSRLSVILKTHWRGSKKRTASSIHQAPFYVVSSVHMPATLVELGFATNPEDFKALTDSSYLELAAQSLYEGLLAYKEAVDKSLPNSFKTPTISSR